MINCCGIVDVLTFDATHPNMMALIQHQQVPSLSMQLARTATFQQEDLVGLGRLVVALGCGTLQAAMRESLPASMQFIAQHYSPDMKNLVT
jgi:PAB-dependent poly(A)-specific ribonuclease subunit 3